MSDVPADKINILLAVKSAQRPQRRAAFSLALPLFLFLLLVFVAPIAVLLATAISNSEPKAVLPKTMLALEQWDGSATPDETVFAALADDLKAAQENRTAALLGKRLNYEIPGMRYDAIAIKNIRARFGNFGGGNDVLYRFFRLIG